MLCLLHDESIMNDPKNKKYKNLKRRDQQQAALECSMLFDNIFRFNTFCTSKAGSYQRPDASCPCHPSSSTCFFMWLRTACRVAHVFLCGYGQPAVLSRAANCCPCLCMHWTDGRHVLKRDETAGRPASGASSKKDTIRLSTVEKQNSTIFFFIFLSTVEKAKA